MSLDAYYESLRWQGLGPDDVDEPNEPPPSWIVVNVLVPVMFDDGLEDLGRVFRKFPMFMEKAAFRWMEYWERKRGKGNVWMEYH